MEKKKYCEIAGSCRVYGNNHYRELIYGYQLTEKEKKDFDYMDDIDNNFTGFRYKNNVYSLDEFMNDFNGFDGHLSTSYFSGILIRFNDSYDGIKVYYYIS